jgi:cytochrome b subunit of formate dehydrogenase
MALALFSIMVALFLGYGAVEEFVVRGVRGGEMQPFLVGLIGIIVSVLLAISGIALWRQWPTARRLVLLAAVSLVAFHVYAALPPHRNVGVLALIVGAGYGLILLGVTASSRGMKTGAV